MRRHLWPLLLQKRRHLLVAAVLGAVLSAFAAVAGAATCAPAKLTHIVVSNVTPGLSAGSFATEPKVFYRIGNDKLRIEEALDKANGIHGLMVVAEPNIWMVNLFDRTGKHIVDPGPTFNARAPVVGTTGISPKLMDLEFGCEAEYIAANAPNATRSETIDGTSYRVYRVEDGAEAVEILTKSGTSVPSFVRYYKNGTLTMALHYDLYVTDLPDDPTLFVVPTGINYTNSN
jgi:hypothetical protein